MTRLEQLRLDAGLSRQDLAAKAGVSARTVLRLESGNVAGKVHNLVALADVLQARPSELLQVAIFNSSEEAA